MKVGDDWGFLLISVMVVTAANRQTSSNFWLSTAGDKRRRESSECSVTPLHNWSDTAYSSLIVNKKKRKRSQFAWPKVMVFTGS